MVEKKWLEEVIHPFANQRIEKELEKLKSNSIIILIIRSFLRKIIPVYVVKFVT